MESIEGFANSFHELRSPQRNKITAPSACSPPKHTLAERSLTESEMHAMIAFTPRWRDQLLLTIEL
jgi:hypothetical protein